MNCGFCNKQMALINMDKKNFLVGHWFCVNKDCPVSIAEIIKHYTKKEHGDNGNVPLVSESKAPQQDDEQESTD
ncbi:hypothetical protein ACFVVQ_12290 [Paenibacillus chitinolyticus]|uniref:hypothetical protein n=1 Tax=Paenibacillus chitinolyticus TaxID=79263 RepID=UPI0036D9F703